MHHKPTEWTDACVNKNPMEVKKKYLVPLQVDGLVSAQKNNGSCGDAVVAYFLGREPSEECSMTYRRAAQLTGGIILATCHDDEKKRSKHPTAMFMLYGGEGHLTYSCVTNEGKEPCDYNSINIWIHRFSRFILLYHHAVCSPTGHYIGLERKTNGWSLIDPKSGKKYVLEDEDMKLVIMGADVVIGLHNKHYTCTCIPMEPL